MTERHRDGLCDLGDNIHRGHDSDGLGKAFQPAKEAVLLDGAAPADHAGHQRPSDGGGKMRRGRAQDAGHANECTKQRRQEQRADIGRPVSVVLAHGVLDHAVEHGNTFLH